MALEEKKNNVKYQGRDDYEVVYYDVPETGKKYFFLDGGKQRLKNGNVIATTNLKVAIDANKPEELADIGVVNPDGQEVIPFDNKRIKAINDELLLAEPTMPVNENVTKAIADRGNPTEATRLVNAANTIKEKLNSNMGSEGKYIFNDLFSEATIYNIDGNNVVNGEYYSFIGMNNENLFLSKNDPESEIVTVPLGTKVEETMVEDTTSQEMVEENNLDVSGVQLDENVVDEAFNNESQNETIVEELPTENLEEETPSEESVETMDDEVLEENTVAEGPVEEVLETPVEESNMDEVVSMPTEETVEEPVSEEIVEDQGIEENYDITEEPIQDIDAEEYNFDDSKVQIDSIYGNDSFDNFVEESDFTDTDMAEGTEIIEKMINKVKEQDTKISSLEKELNEQKEINRNVLRKAKEQEEKINALNEVNDKLEDKSNYYKRAAVTLSDENKSLRVQLEDKDKLLEMLNEAKKLLNGEEEPKYDFDEENVFRRIA